MRIAVLAGALLLWLAAGAHAGAVLTEDFSYADGDLTTQSGGRWQQSTGAGWPIQVVGGEVYLEQGSGSHQEVNCTLHPLRDDFTVTWAGFKLKVSSGVVALGQGDYFAYMGSSPNPICAVSVTAPHEGGDYGLGLRMVPATVMVIWQHDLKFDTYYNVVTRYDSRVGAAQLYVNPVTEASPNSWMYNPNYASLAFDHYGLRQGSDNTCEVVVDDLVVGDTLADLDILDLVPSVSMVGLLLLASLMLGFGALFVVRHRATLA